MSWRQTFKNAEKLTLRFVNVGYGEAMLFDIQHADEHIYILIDGGSAEALEFSNRSSGRIPLVEFLAKEQISHLDLVILTHIHEDHLCGLLEVVKTCTLGAFYQSFSAALYPSMYTLDNTAFEHPSRKKFIQALNDYREIMSLLQSRGTPIFQISEGDVFSLFDNFSMRVLGPQKHKLAGLEARLINFYTNLPEAQSELESALIRFDAGMNNYSLILRYSFGDSILLLPGDTNCHGYHYIPEPLLKASLFKLGHHGQADSLDSKLLSLVGPQYAVCCASSDYRYNSAAPEVLGALKDFGARLFYSDAPPVAAHLDPAPPHEVLIFEFTEAGLERAAYL